MVMHGGGGGTGETMAWHLPAAPQKQNGRTGDRLAR